MDGVSLWTLSQWKYGKEYKEYKDISSGIRSTQLKKNPEWGTGIMDNVYMMDLLRMLFLKATFKQKKYAIKNVEDFSSKE